MRPRITEEEFIMVQRMRQEYNAEQQDTRVLCIGDLHEPFCLDGYLDFCISTYLKYKCNRVVFIGDCVDNHYSSYHEADPDGFSGGDELDLAIFKLKAWYKAFPNADWIIGNHDRIIGRKAMTAAISRRWVRDYNQVLEVPKWKMHEELTIDGVQYIHGEGGTARTRAKGDLVSTVQGHLHTQAYTEYWVGKNYKIFGMQVGCGIDAKSYAMAYAKQFKKPAIGCGVIINGKQAINVMMDL
ncbi:MAG: metallophosphoesterase [Lewinella sp.]|uniref:metallophosphoesterase n=1 Tax=Lewinella sp. TaxID=2004506 RepID=UPI003D6A9793